MDSGLKPRRRRPPLARAEHDVGTYLPGGGVEGWPAHRRLLSRAGGRYAAAVLGLRLTDLTGGYKFSAGALRILDGKRVQTRGYGFQIELTYHAVRAGLEVAEVPIVFRGRERGTRRCPRDRLGGAVEGAAHAPPCPAAGRRARRDAARQRTESLAARHPPGGGGRGASGPTTRAPRGATMAP